MKIVTKVGILTATVMMSIGLLGSPASAKVDTSWGCPGCIAGDNGGSIYE